MRGSEPVFFVLIFDAINEVSQILAQEGTLSRDITSFLAKYPSNRFIFTSRAMHYVPPIALPVFELQPIRSVNLESYLKSRAIASESLAPLMWETLRNPLLLSMFVQLRERSAEIVNTATLLRFYFEDLSHKFTAATGGNVSLMALLSPLAFRLVSEGSQTLSPTMMERELGDVLAMQTDGSGANGAKALRSLISLGILVPDAEGNVGFFHQTALEYVAATELLSRYEKGSFQIGRLLDLLRWDETIILFTALLTPKQRKGLLEEISKVDIILACRAFGSAAIKDENIGLFLFDVVKEKLANTELPEDQKSAIAHAVVHLAPFCRREVLAEWLEDDSIGGNAAIALAQMGAKEFVPHIIARMLEDNMWPSLFAQALEVLADESVLSKLIAKRSSDKESLTNLNIAKVIRRFESDALYSEIEKLRRSVRTKDREFAANLLTELKSERSRSILAEMLSDSSPEVRLEATDALRWADYKKDEVIARMFELLADEECGHSAAEYLFALSDSSILDEAKRRIAQTRNTREIINLCAVLSRSEPRKVCELLFERLHKYDPSFHEDLYKALSKLPTEYLLPDILAFLRVDDIHLHLTILETLRSLDERRLPISEDDCEYLMGLWERSQSKHTRKLWWYGTFIGELLGEQFQAASKPLLLKRLADTKYPFRVALLPVVFRITINEGDLSPALIEWIVSKFSIKVHFFVWAAGEIIGKVATEPMVREKLIPLLSSPNLCVRSNAYEAIKTAEHRLGKRFLKEQSDE